MGRHYSWVGTYIVVSIRGHTVLANVHFVFKAKLICHLLLGTFAQTHLEFVY